MTYQTTSSNVVLIGEFQFTNLVNKRIFFHFFDLRNEAEAALKTIPKVEPVSPENLVAAIKAKLKKDDEPILLICQTGDQSVKWGNALSDLGYKNIFVLKGGVQGLET